MALTTGSRLGSFEILGAIGAGGMGEVYRARDTKLKREVAIKVLPDAFATDPERLARFQREAELLATLNHPNIGAVYGFEQTSETTAIVLELIDGETLADRLKRGAIPVEETLAIARQVAEALEAAHERAIIHRDLKPANITLTPEGKVKVLDFGLAKAVESTPTTSGALTHSPTLSMMATQAGVVLGTAAYMSPEQAKGKPLDRRTDIWAFGCVLYELLTGVRAFDGEEVSDVLAAILRAEPDWGKLPAETPRAVHRLLRRCFEKDRSHRLRDIGDGLAELRDAQLDHEHPQPQATATSHHMPARLLIATAAVVGLAVGTVSMWWARPAIVAPMPARFMLSPSPDSALFLANASRNIDISPDGSTVAYVAADGQLFVRELNRLDPTVIRGAGPIASPFFSPDGRWMGFVTVATREIKKFALTGGSPATVVLPANSTRGITWTSDGKIVFALSDPTMGLQTVSSSGGKPETLLKPDHPESERFLWPEAIPGTPLILFTILRSAVASAQIAVLNVETGQRKVLVDGTHARYSATGHLLYAASGTLFAAPFDVKRSELNGEATAVVDGVEITNAGAAYFDVSDNGSLIFVKADGAQRALKLVWVDRAGKEEILPLPPRRFQIPRIAPDAKRIVANIDSVTNSDIFAYDLASSSEMRLTFDATQEVRPTWSADGKWVFFRSDVSGPGVYRKAADGTGNSEKIVPVVGDGGPNFVSRDSRWLFYSNVDSKTARDIWIVPPRPGSEARPLVVDPGHQGNPSLSPDGRWLAYQDETEGQIYVRPFPNVGAGRWLVSPPNSKWPVWSPDGRELLFVSGDVGKRGLMSVTVQPMESTITWSPPTLLLRTPYVGFITNVGARNYDLSPDGKRFLVIKDASDTQAGNRIVIVQNWLAGVVRPTSSRD